MDSMLTCCLCSFTGVTENDLETHIDTAHPDIFLPATVIKVEPESSNPGQAQVPAVTQEEFEVGRIKETYEQLLNQPGFR